MTAETAVTAVMAETADRGVVIASDEAAETAETAETGAGATPTSATILSPRWREAAANPSRVEAAEEEVRDEEATAGEVVVVASLPPAPRSKPNPLDA